MGASAACRGELLAGEATGRVEGRGQRPNSIWRELNDPGAMLNARSPAHAPRSEAYTSSPHIKLTPLHPIENPQDLTSALLLLSY